MKSRSGWVETSVVGVGSDAPADLVVGAVHLGVVAVDALAGEAEQLHVVGGFQVVPAGAVDRSHVLVLLVMPLGRPPEPVANQASRRRAAGRRSPPLVGGGRR